MLRSPTDSLAPRNLPSVAGSFARPSSPCALSQYLPSRVTAPIRDGRYCGWRRCSKVPVSCSFFGSLLDSPFSFSDSPLVGLRPFSPSFHPSPRSFAWFCGSSLSLAVLAGLLPQVTTYDHRFTIVRFHLPLTSSHYHMLKAHSHQVQPAEHTRRKFSSFGSLRICSIFQSMEHTVPSPSDG